LNPGRAFDTTQSLADRIRPFTHPHHPRAKGIRRTRARKAEWPLSIKFVVPRRRRSSLGKPGRLIVKRSSGPSLSEPDACTGRTVARPVGQASRRATLKLRQSVQRILDMSGPTFKATVDPNQGPAREFRGLEQLAWLMDRAVTIPGTRITLGLDALLGLLPVGGDFLTGLVQAGIVLVALLHYRVPRAVAARMVANVLLDTAIGAIPVVGDAFDVFFKANTRNVRLLQQLQADRSQNRHVVTWTSIAYLAFLGLALFAMLALLLIGFFTVVAWLFSRHPAA
jgi:hypothetical protein